MSPAPHHCLGGSPHSLGHPQICPVPPLSWARQFCQKKCARPFLSATSRLSGGVRYPSPRGAGSLGRSSPYSFQRATNARHADLPGCERNQEQKGTHKTVHVPKDDRSSSCQGHLGLWRVRASVPVQCPHLRQTAQARPPGTESEGSWGSWVLARGLQRQLRAVKVRRSTEPARGERGAGSGERARAQAEASRCGAGRAA